MYKTKLSSLALMTAFLVSGCGSQTNDGMQIKIKNPANGSPLSQVINVPLNNQVSMQTQYKSDHNAKVELVDNDQDGQADTARLLVNVAPGQQQTLQLTADNNVTLADMAHVELSRRTGGHWDGKDYKADAFTFEPVDHFVTPPQLTDHSYYLRYEGPGWENDKIGFRLYLDWRNAIDIYGKKTSDMVLPGVGLDGYESYHHSSDWGQDVLKVGKALGVGALGRLDGDNVMHFQQHENMTYQQLTNDKLSASFSVDYKNWTVGDKTIDLSTHYQVNAGDNGATITASTSEPVDNLVTGLVKHPNTVKLQKRGETWGYIARYGKQSLAGDDDELGFALFYRVDQVERLLDGQYDDLVQFKPSSDSIEYHIVALWPQGVQPQKTQQQFAELLDQELAKLQHPVTQVN
ncbi:DUF4861 family protein [Neptunicella marina]|uniref:DUF4861 family protein n=1 Tax=Neptunicella marina TaxID=2125989 RepID=A0A8J6ISV1_9ALTE|nr:DUF4861 family protein [Neptunicella marina]MBC3765674.1 DUF4861 family protein [Neptunicella marina]